MEKQYFCLQGMLEIAHRQCSRSKAFNNEEKNLMSCSLATVRLKYNLSHDTTHPVHWINVLGSLVEGGQGTA